MIKQMSGLKLSDRVRIENAVHWVDFLLDARVPRARRRQIREELRSNLVEAAQHIGSETAVRQLGDLNACGVRDDSSFVARDFLRVLIWTSGERRPWRQLYVMAGVRCLQRQRFAAWVRSLNAVAGRTRFDGACFRDRKHLPNPSAPLSTRRIVRTNGPPAFFEFCVWWRARSPQMATGGPTPR